MHVPVEQLPHEPHEELQQTPPTQDPLEHEEPELHALPFGAVAPHIVAYVCGHRLCPEMGNPGIHMVHLPSGKFGVTHWDWPS